MLSFTFNDNEQVEFIKREMIVVEGSENCITLRMIKYNWAVLLCRRQESAQSEWWVEEVIWTMIIVFKYVKGLSVWKRYYTWEKQNTWEQNRL